MKQQRRRRPGPSDSFFRTGGALGRLWRELSAELAARGARQSEARAAKGSTASEAPIDTRIGAYQIMGLLGSGGMGEVFLAFDGRLQRHVAIKRIRTGAQMKPQARERLRREAAAAAKLSHPAVVHIYDILEESTGEAIVMEYVLGQTLAQLLASGRRPARQLISVAREVAGGLAAAHAVGLIHRDLKTQNVMVSPSGQAKILDFGLAKPLTPRPDEDSLTSEGALVGTLRAMSPEQVEGRPLDARSDLFSLGVLLYEVCTGRSPFLGDGSQQTLHNVIAEPPPPIRVLNPDLPPPLAGLIEELLEKDPARRPADAAGVEERLREIEQLPALQALELPYALDATDPAVRPSRDEERWRLPWPRPRPSTARPLAAAAGIGLLMPGERSVLRTGSRRRWPWGAGLLLTFAMALAVTRLQSRPSGLRPLAVLVQEPRVAPSSEQPVHFAAFALREAALRALAGLEGIEPMGPEELPAGTLSVPEAARAVAADEVVTSTITAQGQWCRVSLRRQRGRDGRVVRDTGSFDVPSDREASLTLANAVAIHLRQAFPDHRPRSAHERLEVQSSDYPRYLSLRRRVEAGEVLTRADLDDLEQLGRSSPGLTEAAILAVSAARTLPDRPRAERILQEAEARHRDDPRLITERFLLNLEIGRLAEAEQAVAELDRLAPGDILATRARARLLARRGKLPEAAALLRQLARERPSWQNLWYVADVELQLADATGARQHLEQLLQVSPGNPQGRSKMAELEWLMSDPAVAARIYEGLLKERVTRQNLSNLGWSLLLAGDYPAAAAALRRALELEPAHLTSRMNLAVANEGAGDEDSARRLYRDVLARVTQREHEGTLSLSERLIKARALAQLGDPAPAVDLTFQVLAEGERDAQALFQAAVIYALCGERNHAIMQAREARRRGLSPRWFTVPGFESLRDVPAFRELLPPA